MRETTPDRLHRLATAFRNAIERADRASLGITFDHFPRGSCGDASPLLAHYLKTHGLTDAVYISGERGQANVDWTSHAWLRVDGYIVDITADQFTEVEQRVFVTRESPWHETFDIEDEHEGDFTIYQGTADANLARIYAAIMDALV